MWYCTVKGRTATLKNLQGYGTKESTLWLLAHEIYGLFVVSLDAFKALQSTKIEEPFHRQMQWLIVSMESLCPCSFLQLRIRPRCQILTAY